MNADQLGEWASQHKPIVLGGAAVGALGLLYLLHRRASANATSSTTGATVDTGTVPDTSTADNADSGGTTSGVDDTAQLDALTAAITGLTTSVNNLDPATGPANDGTDGAGQPTKLKPILVHTAKQPTPPTKRTARHKQMPKKTATTPRRLTNPRRPVERPRAQPHKSKSRARKR